MSALILLRRIPKVFWTVLIFLLLIIFTIFGLLSSLWRKILLRIVRKLHPEVTSLVPSRSTGFGVDPLYSAPKCAVLLSFECEGIVEFQSFRDVLEPGYIKATLPNGRLKYPEANQHIESYFGYLFWNNNSSPLNFDEFVIPLDYTNEQNLQELKLRLLQAPFEKNKPLHTVYFVNRYKNDERKTLIMYRFHHVLGDGASLMHLCLVQLMQLKLPEVQGTYFTASGQRQSWLDKLKSLSQLPFRFSDELVTFVQHRFKRMYFMVPEERQSGLFFMMECEDVSVVKIKAIKNAFNVGFTSVLIAAITFVLREVLILRGCSIDEHEELPCILPIPTHTRFGRLRNNMTAAWTKLPLGEASLINCLMKCEADMKRIKSSVFPLAMHKIAWLVGSYPSKVAKLTSANKFAPVGISNLPGPKNGFSWGGASFRKGFYSAGLQNGITGLAEAVSESEMNFMRARIPKIFDDYFHLLGNLE